MQREKTWQSLGNVDNNYNDYEKMYLPLDFDSLQAQYSWIEKEKKKRKKKDKTNKTMFVDHKVV